MMIVHAQGEDAGHDAVHLLVPAATAFLQVAGLGPEEQNEALHFSSHAGVRAIAKIDHD